MTWKNFKELESESYFNFSFYIVAEINKIKKMKEQTHQKLNSEVGSTEFVDHIKFHISAVLMISGKVNENQDTSTILQY